MWLEMFNDDEEGNKIMSVPDMFNAFVEIIIDHEGGYVNDPDDPGGETKYGISKRAYPELDIANLTKDDAKTIYHRDYWKKVGGPSIAELSPGVALVAFDHAVNAGVDAAVKILQSLAGSKVDGVFGPNTNKAVKKWVKNKPDNDKAFQYPVNEYTTRRLADYVEIANFDKYGDGWFNRVISTHNYAIDEETIQDSSI